MDPPRTERVDLPRTERIDPPRTERAERIGISRSGAGSPSWVDRFAHELTRIARAETRDPPLVIPSEAVPNVGANASMVVVNPAWMQQVSDEICGDETTCVRDLVRGIAGHEWGHVIEDRHRAGGSAHDKELAADRTAGRILAESGADPWPLLQLLGESDAAPSLTHPGAHARVAAVQAGHHAAGGCRGEGTCRCRDEPVASAPAPVPAAGGCRGEGTHGCGGALRAEAPDEAIT